MSMVPESRIRTLRSEPIRGDGEWVLYWMTASRRLSWNFALDRALEIARLTQRPLLIFEALSVSYRWASDRHHQAIIDGMTEHRAETERRGVGYFPYVEPHADAGQGLLDVLTENAVAVVTDDSPVFFTPGLLRAAEKLTGVQVEAVDSCGLLPLRTPGKSYSAAYHFRRFLQKELPAHLSERPNPDPLGTDGIVPFRADLTDISARWPDAAAAGFLEPGGVASLPIDHSVGVTDWNGGTATGRRAMERFLDEDLDGYGVNRNHPDRGGASGLSPWLHYGQISTHEVFASVAAQEEWSPLRISDTANGRREGWWGMSAAAEAFLDQLITWRELGYGFAVYEPDYQRYERLPDWARATLEDHLDDPRTHLYSLEEFAAAETHDELWNAAQRQLVHDGVIHNYLRMLWGKKILEWTEHPRHALEIMIELNNRYALDGRDPNSYSGITWVMGRFDRGWPERAVYGKVRCMTSASTRRKLDVTRYLERWGADGG